MSDNDQPNKQSTQLPVEDKPEIINPPEPLMKSEPVGEETGVKREATGSDNPQARRAESVKPENKPDDKSNDQTTPKQNSASSESTPAEESFTVSANKPSASDISPNPEKAAPENIPAADAPTPLRPKADQPLAKTPTTDQPAPIADSSTKAADMKVTSFDEKSPDQTLSGQVHSRPAAPAKKPGKKMAGILIAVLFILLTIPAAVFLARQNQDIRQRAVTSGHVNKGQWNFCNNSGCDTGADYPKCYVNHYWTKDKNDSTITDILLDFGKQSASLGARDCGAEQIDAACVSDYGGVVTVGYAWRIYDQSCADEPAPSSSPQPSVRPNLCVDASVDNAVLGPNDVTKVTSTSSQAANYFYYYVYNLNNLFGPGNPKPVCVSSGGDVTNVTGSCPADTYHLIYRDPNTALRTTGVRPLAYADLFVLDKNNDQMVTKVQINAYFQIGTGMLSVADANCVVSVEARQDWCVSSSITSGSLLPGQSTTITSVSKTQVNNFTYALYNLDNLYGPSNPKPVCVTSGGDVTNIQGSCPSGTYHLRYKDTNTALRTTGSRTVTYEQIFVADRNNNNQAVQRLQVLAFFQVDNGAISLPNPACVVYANQAVATPLPTPTPIPTPTPSPSPSSTPTPPPVGAQCVAVKIYQVTGDIGSQTNWQILTPEQMAALQPGDIIYVTTLGTVSNGTIDKARIRVNSNIWTPSNETTLTKPCPPVGPCSIEYYISYTIPSNGTTTFNFGAEVHEVTTNKWY